MTTLAEALRDQLSPEDINEFLETMWDCPPEFNFPRLVEEDE